MNEISLKGLAGSHPLGALAAFGLLRSCEEMDGFCGSRLGWRREADWFAVLQTEEEVGPEELVKSLVARQKQRPEGRELNWARTIKTSRTSYREATSEARNALREGHRAFAGFLSAFACDLCADDNDQLEPTAFYMTSGRQEFLKEAQSLAKRLAQGISIGRRKKTSAELFQEALFGPWKYEDPQHSLGWDSSTERLHALRAKSPTKESSEGVTAAVWLAFEAPALISVLFLRGEADYNRIPYGRSDTPRPSHVPDLAYLGTSGPFGYFAFSVESDGIDGEGADVERVAETRHRGSVPLRAVQSEDAGSLFHPASGLPVLVIHARADVLKIKGDF